HSDPVAVIVARCGDLYRFHIAADSFPGNGAGINLFAADGAPTAPENSAVNFVPVSYLDGVLSYGGNAAQNSYDFFDVLSVFCSRYGEIRQLQVESFSFDDIRVYYYDTATGARRVIDGPLTNGVIYPQLDVDGTPMAITYNALCSGIADGAITSFYLVINDETHPETQDTQISIVEQISNLFRKALRAIVTLLNKLFRLLKNFG
ncbi:MAG: hypothetical protein IJL25_06810, partial [Clostridia bacterium]|nr:hypothetical protein [Clostridia bacterium]